MQLKPETDKALDKWIGIDTWHTTDPYDMNRFFDFVNQYQKDHGYEIDESALQEEIERRVTKGGRADEILQNIIRSRISLAYNILDFLKRTKR